MCGIVYNYNFGGETASNRVLKQYKRQIHRGTTSYGFALPDKHVMSWKVDYKDIVKALRRTVNPEILFHHRLSTSTADRPTACHPFSTKDVFETEFVGVHNGMLRNEHELYEKHKERFGIRYVSDNGTDFNDSEAYIYDLASYFSGITDGIEMTGYGAFILVEYDKETHQRLRLHFGTTNTTSAPLKVHLTENHLDVTSEGKGWAVQADTHYIYDYADNKLTNRPLVHATVPYERQFSPYYESDYDGYTRTPDSEHEQYMQDVADLADYYGDSYGYDDDLAFPDDFVEEQMAELYPGKQLHFGWSMYKNGCCDKCDMRMEITGDFSSIQDPKLSNSGQVASDRKAIEAVIVQKAIDKQAQTA